MPVNLLKRMHLRLGEISAAPPPVRDPTKTSNQTINKEEVKLKPTGAEPYTVKGQKEELELRRAAEMRQQGLWGAMKAVLAVQTEKLKKTQMGPKTQEVVLSGGITAVVGMEDPAAGQKPKLPYPLADFMPEAPMDGKTITASEKSVPANKTPETTAEIKAPTRATFNALVKTGVPMKLKTKNLLGQGMTGLKNCTETFSLVLGTVAGKVKTKMGNSLQAIAEGIRTTKADMIGEDMV